MNVIYHCTTDEGLSRILSTNTLEARNGRVCFSRDKNHVPGSFHCRWRIALDRDKLHCKYRIIPYGKMPDADYAGRSEASESEERIYKDIKNIKDYIIDVEDITYNYDESDCGYLSDFDDDFDVD